MSGEFEPACRKMDYLDPFYKKVWEKAFADAVPITGTFELTPRCNFQCRMCYVHLKADQIPKYGREFSAEEWIRIAREAKEAGTVWLCITGGEPLLHPEFETIYTELSRMGFFITLQTNASLLNEKAMELLEEYPPRSVKITLYGSNDEVYEKVCRVKDGFTRVDHAIQELRKRKIPVSLVSTVIRQNEEDVKNMALYALKNGLPWVGTGGIRLSVRGAESEAAEVRVQEKTDEQKRQEIRYLMEHQPVDISRRPCTYCKDYRIGYWITWNGNMQFCGFMSEPANPVRGRAFLEAWRDLVQFETELDWPTECKTCEAQSVCRKCAATLATESGSVHRVSEEYCSRVKKDFKEMKGE